MDERGLRVRSGIRNAVLSGEEDRDLGLNMDLDETQDVRHPLLFRPVFFILHTTSQTSHPAELDFWDFCL